MFVGIPREESRWEGLCVFLGFLSNNRSIRILGELKGNAEPSSSVGPASDP